MKKLTSLLGSGLLLLVAPTHADFDAGLAAYNQGDYQSAFMEFQALANRSDAEAQYHLGRMYYEGKGTAENKIQAYMWVNLSSSLGYQKATRYNVILKTLMSPTQVEEAERLTDQWFEKNTH